MGGEKKYFFFCTRASDNQMSFNHADVKSAGTDAWSCLLHGFKSGMGFASGADTGLPVLITLASFSSKYIYINMKYKKLGQFNYLQNMLEKIKTDYI